LKWCGMISWEKVAGMTASVFWLKLSKQNQNLKPISLSGLGTRHAPVYIYIFI
jgi:hypothetical protein